MVIQGSSFLRKARPADEQSLSRHHFAQTGLAACARAVRHSPKTLLALCSRIILSDAASEASSLTEHQTLTSAFPSRLRVRPTAGKLPLDGFNGAVLI